MKSEGQLDCAEIPSEVASQLGNDVDDLVADLLGNLLELAAVELAQVVRGIDRIE
jgi:hypothetical protein